MSCAELQRERVAITEAGLLGSVSCFKEGAVSGVFFSFPVNFSKLPGVEGKKNSVLYLDSSDRSNHTC